MPVITDGSSALIARQLHTPAINAERSGNTSKSWQFHQLWTTPEPGGSHAGRRATI